MNFRIQSLVALLVLICLSKNISSQTPEKLEYRTDGSVLSASGVEKDGSHYTKVYDNHGNVIARFISGDDTYKRGRIIFYGEDENMEYPYFDYSNVIL